MRLESLTVKGVLAFDQAVTLDFTGLPPGAIVAVVGGNGAGKTTVMEGPIGGTYRTFPFREKAVLDYATSRDSLLEAVWRLDDGHTYRARLNLDGVRRTSEGILERDGVLLNDGKVSTLDEAVAKVFPPLRVLLGSAFCAQNRRGSFITLDRKGRKELFADFRGLARFEVWAARAREEAAKTEAERNRLQARADELARFAGADIETDLQARENTLQVTVGQLEERRTATVQARTTLAAERHTVAQDAERHATAKADLQALAIETQAVEAERTRIVKTRCYLVESSQQEQTKFGETLMATFRRLLTRTRMAEAERDKAQVVAQKQYEQLRNDREERIENNRAVLAEAETVRAQGAELQMLSEARPQRAEAVHVARQAVRAATDAYEPVRAAVLRLEGAVERLADYQAQAAMGEKLPFGSKCLDARCSLAGLAVTARDKAAELADAPAQLAVAHAQEPALIEAREDAVTALQDADERLADLDARITALNGTAKKLAALDVAEAKIAEHERAIEEARQSAHDAHVAAASRYGQAIADLTDEALTAVADYDDTLVHDRHDEETALYRLDQEAEDTAARQREIVGRCTTASGIAGETALAAARLAEIDGQDAAHARAWAESEATRGRLEAEQAALTVAWQALTARRAELAAIPLAAVGQDLIEWQTLARIFHRDGLPTLLIAAAGPEVADLTNDLLRASFGGRFVVDLVTQEAKVSGKGLKETFELKVLDSEHGGEARDLSDLSGGEQIIVDEALKAALALYAKRHAQITMDTCWRDETTAGLDEGNRARYLPMLRRLQQLGGFHSLFFVTHDAEVAAQADAQIQVGGGTARLVLPPFDTQAA